MGVWGLRPQRVQGRALAFLLMLQGYGWQMVQGAGLTLELAFLSLFFGVCGGILGAAAKLSPVGFVRVPATLITNLLRGIPEFVILLIAYFGVTSALFNATHGAVEITPVEGAVFALSIVFASYASETFRGAFLAIPRGQTEAACSFGMTGRTIFLRVQLPQAWRLALPSLGNQWQSLLKDTSLVSVLGLEELIRKASIAGQVTKQHFTFYAAAAAMYLLFLGLSQPVFAAMERHARRGMAR